MSDNQPIPRWINEGVIFEDCDFHLVLCTSVSVDDDEMRGISLINGTMRTCSISHCGVGKLPIHEVLAIREDFEGYRARRIASVPGHPNH